MNQTFTSDIVNLNVGGTKFSTSRQTLCSIQDSFFSSLLSGRIPTCRDETGALFIDRDPKYFSVILNFLRTKELNLNGIDVSYLRHEAEFYGIVSLVKRLILCEDLDRSLCGDVLFTGFIPTPILSSKVSNFKLNNTALAVSSQISSNDLNINVSGCGGGNNPSGSGIKPGNVHRINNSMTASNYSGKTLDVKGSIHSRNSSIDYITPAKPCSSYMTHSRKSSSETSANFNGNSYSNNTSNVANNNNPNSSFSKCHSRNQSLELKQIKTDLGIILTDLAGSTGNRSSQQEQNSHQHQQQQKDANTNNHLQVNLIVGHLNWISVAYSHFVCCYKLKDGMGWQLMFQSGFIDEEIERQALNSKHQSTSSGSSSSTTSPNLHSSNIIGAGMSSSSSNQSTGGGGGSSNSSNISSPNSSPLIVSTMSSPQNSQLTLENSKMCALLAIAVKSCIKLWLVIDDSTTHLIGNFSFNANVDNLFFIGSQLVATSSVGKIGVWNSISQLWQTQDMTPISSFDTAGSFLLLGGQNGVLYYIDMQKFPLRMKDNDLLVTELYKDPLGESITALSVYLTPKTTNTGNWIEIAYGTHTGQVRVIVQHPETVGHGPQLFQSFSVHRGAIVKVTLTEKHLVSVCSESFHVRTWNVTRFRGMISTQPGSTPLASFKIVVIDALDASLSYASGNDIGPFGERDNYQVFIQKVVPYTDQLFVRLSSTGKRVCTIKSVDYSTITSFCVHECDGPARLNSRPRRYLFTGHSNGTIQLWDLTTALELKPCDQSYLGGPSASEFVKLLDQCDLASNSGYSTPTTNCTVSPSCINFNSFGPLANNNKLFNKNLLINSNNAHQSLDENEKN